MIKEIVYQWKTKSILKKDAKKETISFDKAKNIGLLFDNEDNYKATKSFIDSLTSEGKIVTVLIKSKEKEAPSNQHFTLKDCKWHGKIESAVVDKFIQNPFDYLFLLNEEPHYLTEFILASSKAKCKVGIHNEAKEQFFELMFDNSKKEPIDKFYKTVKGYLDKIKA